MRMDGSNEHAALWQELRDSATLLAAIALVAVIGFLAATAVSL